METFAEVLASLNTGKPPGPVAIIGPRGQGKTALMDRMWDMGGKAMPAMRVLDMSTASIDSIDALREHLDSASHEEGMPPAVMGTTAEVGAKFGGTGASGVRRTIKERRALTPEAALRALCSDALLLVLVDEAHTLDLKVGQALLHAEQIVRRRGTPIQFVFAGTPDMRPHFRKMRSTFWSRLDEREMRLRLLDEPDAFECIALPFSKAPRWCSFTDEARGKLQELSHGYPYFIPALGSALWHTVPQDVRTIEVGHVEKAAPRFGATRDDYYQERLEEIDDAGWLRVGWGEGRQGQAVARDPRALGLRRWRSVRQKADGGKGFVRTAAVQADRPWPRVGVVIGGPAKNG